VSPMRSGHDRHRPSATTAGAPPPRASPVFLKDLWPLTQRSLTPFRASDHAPDVRGGVTRKPSPATSAGRRCPRPTPSPTTGTQIHLREAPPYFEGLTMEPGVVKDIEGARVLARLAIRSPPTTSLRRATSERARPRGSTSSTGACTRRNFNSYGTRRGNHEVMVRGTFANIRLRT